MQFRRPTSEEDRDEDDVNEIEEDIRPPVKRRLTQFLIAALVITTAVSLIVAKVMSDQGGTAKDTADKAVAAQSTAQAQVTRLSQELSAATPAPTALAQNRTFFTAPDGTPAAGNDYRREYRGRFAFGQSRSIQLAYTALQQLPIDPERSLLIALAANQAAHTPEAEDALRRALLSSRLRLRVSASDSPVRSAAFSPDGDALLLNTASGPARLLNSRTGVEMLQFPPANADAGTVVMAQFSPDGRSILTVLSDGSARLWDARSGAITATLAVSNVNIIMAGFSHDGKRIAAASLDGSARVWNTAAITNPLILVGHSGSIQALEWSADDARILAVGPQGATVWDAATGQHLFTEGNTPAGNAIFDAHFSPDGAQIITTGSSFVRILDSSTGETVRVFSGTRADYAEYSLNGDWLLTGGLLWNTRNGQLVYAFPRSPTSAAQFSPDSRYVATQSDTNTLSVWQTPAQDGQPSQVVSIQSDAAFISASFSRDSTALLTVNSDGSARVWSLTDDVVPVDYISLLAMGNARVTRQLSCDERRIYLGETAACAAATPAP